jgi:hypothetical protein
VLPFYLLPISAYLLEFLPESSTHPSPTSTRLSAPRPKISTIGHCQPVRQSCHLSLLFRQSFLTDILAAGVLSFATVIDCKRRKLSTGLYQLVSHIRAMSLLSVLDFNLHPRELLLFMSMPHEMYPHQMNTCDGS